MSTIALLPFTTLQKLAADRESLERDLLAEAAELVAALRERLSLPPDDPRVTYTAQLAKGDTVTIELQIQGLFSDGRTISLCSKLQRQHDVDLANKLIAAIRTAVSGGG
jgi:hypothetical protein